MKCDELQCEHENESFTIYWEVLLWQERPKKIAFIIHEIEWNSTIFHSICFESIDFVFDAAAISRFLAIQLLYFIGIILMAACGTMQWKTIHVCAQMETRLHFTQFAAFRHDKHEIWYSQSDTKEEEEEKKTQRAKPIKHFDRQFHREKSFVFAVDISSLDGILMRCNLKWKILNLNSVELSRFLLF